MYKLIAFLILIPTLAFGESLVYLKSTPKALYRQMQGPVCGVEADGDDVDQPILIAQPEGTEKAFWAVLIPDAKLAAFRAKPSFLGKGLTEVKVAYPGAYRKMVNWTWELKTDPAKRYTVPMSDNTYSVGTLYRKVEQDIPMQTFGGYNPLSGDPQ
jgi:hypothetical protein